jgi:hypothetical protein
VRQFSFDRASLYNVENDLSEQHDLTEKYPEKVARTRGPAQRLGKAPLPNRKEQGTKR